MDVSVNMKMTADEHRLLRQCVTEARDEAQRVVDIKVGDPEWNGNLHRAAREKLARTQDLLAKI